MKGCRPLRAEEIEAVVAQFGGSCRLRDRALFLVGIHTGFRISELLSIRVGDVIEGGRIVERLAVRRRHMKGRREGRSVPLHRRAIEALRPWLVELASWGYAHADDLLFQSRTGGNRAISRQQAWRVLVRRYRESGVGHYGIGTHGMRKTLAQRVYERLGRDLIRTQAALGHMSVSSTAAYLSFDQREIDEAIMREEGTE